MRNAYDLDDIQLEFVNWITTYYGVTKNVTGRDRLKALDAMNNDLAFDSWLKNFAKEQERKARESGMDEKSRSAGMTAVSKEEFLMKAKGKLPNPSREENA